jgi:hypothetical protein
LFYVCVTALALLGNLEGELAKVLLVPHVLVGLLEAGEVKDLVIDDGVDVVGLNGSAHVLHLQARADEDTADGADVHEGVEVGRLVLAHAADEADDGDDAVNGDGLERLRHGSGSADLDDVLDADAAGRQLLGLLTPVGRLLVVDDVVGAVLLQLVVAMTRAPAAFANCSAKMLTPPVPCVRTVWPGLSARLSRPYSAFQAVRPAQLRVLDSRKLRFEGAATRPCSLKTP